MDKTKKYTKKYLIYQYYHFCMWDNLMYRYASYRYFGFFVWKLGDSDSFFTISTILVCYSNYESYNIKRNSGSEIRHKHYSSYLWREKILLFLKMEDLISLKMGSIKTKGKLIKISPLGTL